MPRPGSASVWAIALLKARKRDGQVSNPAGYFVQALRPNWGSEVASTEVLKILNLYLGFGMV